jgi:uncharacterized protein YcfJ
MKSALITAMSLAAVVSSQAFAATDVVYDYATVIAAEPVVRTIRVSTPREECWDERVIYRNSYDGRSSNNGVGTVLGGVVGGALGNAVGHNKSNKQVGAVVGAVLGATVGHAIASQNSRQQSGSRDVHGTEEVCKIYNDYREEDRIVGYDVRYRYHNETFTTRTTTDPGDTIKVRLSISPVI